MKKFTETEIQKILKENESDVPFGNFQGSTA